MLLVLLLACTPAPPAAPAPPPAAAVPPAEPAVLTEDCATGRAEACAALGSAARRDWAEAVVVVGLGGPDERRVGDLAAQTLALRGCALGDRLACRDAGDRGPWAGQSGRVVDVTDPGVPYTRVVTLVDEAGAPRVGWEVRVFVPPAQGVAAVLHTDVRGQVRVPPAETAARLEGEGLSGPVRDHMVVHDAPPPRDGAPAVSFTRPATDPWAVPDPTPLLVGTWTRQPNALSDTSIPPLFEIHLDLPGATGGVQRSDPPPQTLRFEPRRADGLTLDGEPVTIVPGTGVLRLERGDEDAWIVPVERDTFVYRPPPSDRWRYAEVYRRKL